MKRTCLGLHWRLFLEQKRWRWFLRNISYLTVFSKRSLPSTVSKNTIKSIGHHARYDGPILPRLCQVTRIISSVLIAWMNKVPKSFRTRKAIAKSRSLWLQSCFININRGSLHKRNFRCIHFSVFRYRWTKNGVYGPEKFPGHSRNGLLAHAVAIHKLLETAEKTWQQIFTLIAAVNVEILW